MTRRADVYAAAASLVTVKLADDPQLECDLLDDVLARDDVHVALVMASLVNMVSAALCSYAELTGEDPSDVWQRWALALVDELA